eukprot:g74698.t1
MEPDSEKGVQEKSLRENVRLDEISFTKNKCANWICRGSWDLKPLNNGEASVVHAWLHVHLLSLSLQESSKKAIVITTLHNIFFRLQRGIST